MRIGWIGVGVMGSRMVSRLIEAGHTLTLWNRSKEKLIAFKDKATIAQSIQELAKDKDIIISMVGFPKDVNQVYEELLAVVSSSTILIDMTTSSPMLARSIAKRFHDRGGVFLDAPVTGGDGGAKDGTLTFMVGGDEQAYKTLNPLFKNLGKNIMYMGASGYGMIAKLANQIAIAGTIASLAESLQFAKLQGLDASMMLTILNSGAAQSFQSLNQGPKMIKGNNDAGFFIKHFQKDLGLALESATTELPITKHVKSLYDWMVQQGHQDLGTQAIIDYFKNQSSSK
jgi:3-hydroxyisobutyrate dehydrogenase-like beta-hydroxyacid dehydrogenase